MFSAVTQVHPVSSSRGRRSSAASPGRRRNGSFSKGQNLSSSRSYTNNGGDGTSEGNSSESSSSGSDTGESSDRESSDSEGSDSEGSDSESSDSESRTSTEGQRTMHSESSSVQRAAAEDSRSSILRCMSPPRRDTRFVPSLCNAAIVRGILENFEQHVEKNVEALEKQFLSQPPLPDTLRLELLGRVNRVVDASNELDRRRWRKGFLLRAAAAAATQDAASQGSKKEVTQVPAAEAPSIDNEQAARSRNITPLTLSAKQQQDSSAVAHYGGAQIKVTGVNGKSRHWADAVTREKTRGSQSIWLREIDGGATTERGAKARKGESSRPTPAAARGALVHVHKLLPSDTDIKGYSSDGDAKDTQIYESEHGEGESIARYRGETLRPSDFINGFRLMLQPVIDDPLERYVRIRSPDSAVLRLLDYYQEYADLHEIWDWERDPLLGNSSDVLYPQTPTLDVEAMLRDAVSLHEQLLRINMGNERALKRMQEQLVEAWTEADPAVKEAERLFVKSVTAVADAIYTQKRIDDWNLTVLANRALGKREKYFMYDPGTGRLRLLRDAYMASIITKEIDSEKLTRRLHKKIAALFLKSMDKHRTGKHRQREGSRKRKGTEETRAAGPSAATAAEDPARDVALSVCIKKVLPAADVTVPAGAAGIGVHAAGKGESFGAAVRFPADAKKKGKPLSTPRQGLLAAVHAAPAPTPSGVKVTAKVEKPVKPTAPLSQGGRLLSVTARPPKLEQSHGAAAPQITFEHFPVKQDTSGPKTQLQGQTTQKALNGKPVPQIAKLPHPVTASAKIPMLKSTPVAAPGAGKPKLIPPTSASAAAPTTADIRIALPMSESPVFGAVPTAVAAGGAPVGAVTSLPSATAPVHKPELNIATDSSAKGTLLGSPGLCSDGGASTKIAATSPPPVTSRPTGQAELAAKRKSAVEGSRAAGVTTALASELLPGAPVSTQTLRRSDVKLQKSVPPATNPQQTLHVPSARSVSAVKSTAFSSSPDTSSAAATQISAAAGGPASVPLRRAAPTLAPTSKEVVLPSPMTTSKPPVLSTSLAAASTTTPSAFSSTIRAGKRTPMDSKPKLLPKRLPPPPLKTKM